jgi:two-component system response regulator YesN
MFKLLIVEDNFSFRDSLKEILLARFPEMFIEEAGDGDEAMQKVDSFQPDLIFMDVKLPGESGLKLTERIKIRYPKMKIVVLTSYDLPEYREAAARFGANDFLTKGSSTREEILKLVESLSSDLSKSP